VPANPVYAEIIGRYLSRNAQDDVKRLVPETPWVREDGLDTTGILSAFQQLWRENAGANRAPFEYNEAYPLIVLMAFLQRVLNGGGEIVREMALGKGTLDLGVKFRRRRGDVEGQAGARGALLMRRLRRVRERTCRCAADRF